MEPSDRSKYDPRIDVLRAIAFLLVALPHFSVPTWTDSIVDRGWVIDTVALSLIKTGWFGVPLFLFISGYSLALGKCAQSYTLDTTQFYTNRLLRIFPVWIVCVLMLSFTQHLSGNTVFALLLLQTQDIPSSTAFGIAWSIQLEFMCYLIYPVLLSAIARESVIPIALFFLLTRIALYFLPTPALFWFEYGTIFGGGTIFLFGMLTASLRPMPKGRRSRVSLWVGIALLCGFSVFIARSGGYQTPRGPFIHWAFLVAPEIFSAIAFLILRGGLTAGSPTFGIVLPKVRRLPFNVFAHIGRVSYSGYMFSLFVLDFTGRVFGFIKPGGWHSLIPAFLLYQAVLIPFATVSYYAIELPFLSMRRRYVRQEQPSLSIAAD